MQDDDPPAERSRLLREDGFRWEGAVSEAYKAEGDHFRGATRQTLVGEPAGESAPAFETRYFEVAPGGYTTLERHGHAHVVVVVRGRAEVVLDDRLVTAEPLDCLYIAPWSWHQLHAVGEAPLGFLCIVDRDRDRPCTPDADTLERLRAIPEIAHRIRS